MPARRAPAHVYWIALFALLLAGCGGGGMQAPPAPVFTSTPTTAAEEGMMYTYTVTATSVDGSPVQFVLTAGPVSTTLEANTVMWTPNHAQSRQANAFTVTATTAKGGSATQTWSVTPNGNINITDIVTRWSSSG